MRVHIIRLSPGHDLRGALQAFAASPGMGAAFILSGIGSLTQANLRFAGREAATQLQGDLEILALAGTLAPDGCHVHASVSDAQGHVSGGHVLAGCIIRTTAEIVIGVAPNLSLSREHDEQTGYRELSVSPTLPKG
jgi:predicted DNA-binding protein with PD1-like motif